MCIPLTRACARGPLLVAPQELTEQDDATRDDAIRAAQQHAVEFRRRVLEEGDESALEAQLQADLDAFRNGDSPIDW